MAKTSNLTIRAGITLIVSFTYQDSSGSPIDITGATIRSQVRACIDDTDSLVDWSTGNGAFVIIDAANGVFELQLTAATTASYTFESGVYDIEIEFPTGTVNPLVAGRVFVNQMVTRDDTI